MHALDQVSRATGDPRYNLWARELAAVAHRSFIWEPAGPDVRRMVWKTSTDLSRPLVPSMGQHDPLDGLVTCIQLETTAVLLSSSMAGPRLTEAVADFASMFTATDLRTADSLGLGGLLSDACRVAQLMERGAFEGGNLLETLLAGAQDGLLLYSRRGDWRQPASRRLAFRELGLAVGLFAIELIQGLGRGKDDLFARRPGARARLEALASYVGLGSAISSFWLDPEHRRARTWLEHREINEVMLATSLIPDGYLIILPDI